MFLLVLSCFFRRRQQVNNEVKVNSFCLALLVVNSLQYYLTNSPLGGLGGLPKKWDLVGTWYGIARDLPFRFPVNHTPLLTYTQKSKKNKGKCQLFLFFYFFAHNMPRNFNNFNYFNKKETRTSCRHREPVHENNIYIYN